MMTIRWLTGLFTSSPITIGVGAALLFMVWQWDHNRIKSAERRGSQKVVQDSNKQARKRNETSQKIRASNPVSGAAERLRRKYGRRD
jgi:hypothetical protein